MYTLENSGFQPTNNQKFKITYADKHWVNGSVGTTPVTLAGITVENQVIGLAMHAGWQGDYITSGIAGFAYPAL